MKENIKYFYNLFESRYDGIRKEIKILVIISFLSIIITEFWLNKIEFTYQIQYDFGIIYIKLCYSYLSAFIFYYLVIFAPKERKRVKAFRFINNKIHKLNDYINSILITIIRVTEPQTNELKIDIEFKEIDEYCKKVKPNSTVNYYDTGIILHNDYYDFISFKTEKIKSLVDELILLNDLLDDNLFLNLSNINDIINDLKMDYKIFNYKNLDFISYSLNDLNFEKKEIWENFRKYKLRYAFQYHRFERVRNQRKK